MDIRHFLLEFTRIQVLTLIKAFKSLKKIENAQQAKIVAPPILSPMKYRNC